MSCLISALTAEDLACPQVDKDEKDLKDLYPNCHVHIWLRSCKHEVCTPLGGTVTGKARSRIDKSVMAHSVTRDTVLSNGIRVIRNWLQKRWETEPRLDVSREVTEPPA